MLGFRVSSIPLPVSDNTASSVVLWHLAFWLLLHCIQHSTAQHSTAQHSTAQHDSALRSVVQLHRTQHSTAQHSAALVSTCHRLVIKKFPISHSSSCQDLLQSAIVQRNEGCLHSQRSKALFMYSSTALHILTALHPYIPQSAIQCLVMFSCRLPP